MDRKISPFDCSTSDNQTSYPPGLIPNCPPPLVSPHSTLVSPHPPSSLVSPHHSPLISHSHPPPLVSPHPPPPASPHHPSISPHPFSLVSPHPPPPVSPDLDVEGEGDNHDQSSPNPSSPHRDTCSPELDIEGDDDEESNNFQHRLEGASISITPEHHLLRPGEESSGLPRANRGPPMAKPLC